MNSIKKFSRRAALQKFLLGLCIPWCPSRSDASTANQLRTAIFEVLSETYGSLEIAVQIGREYIRLYPEEATVQELPALAFTGGPARNWSESDEARDHLRKRLKLRIQSDFKTGNCVDIHGWVLSLSEARGCALVALTAEFPASRFR